MTQALADRAKRLHATGFTYAAISEILHCDRNTISRCRARGWRARAKLSRPTPFDFALYASDESITDLQRRYICGQAQIYAWLDAAGIKRKSLSGRNRVGCMRPCPESFRQHGRDMNRIDAAAHWNASRPVITRWRKECGFETPRADLLAGRKARAPEARIGWVERYVAERRQA